MATVERAWEPVFPQEPIALFSALAFHFRGESPSWNCAGVFLMIPLPSHTAVWVILTPWCLGKGLFFIFLSGWNLFSYQSSPVAILNEYLILDCSGAFHKPSKVTPSPASSMNPSSDLCHPNTWSRHSTGRWKVLIWTCLSHSCSWPLLVPTKFPTQAVTLSLLESLDHLNCGLIEYCSSGFGCTGVWAAMESLSQSVCCKAVIQTVLCWGLQLWQLWGRRNSQNCFPVSKGN